MLGGIDNKNNYDTLMKQIPSVIAADSNKNKISWGISLSATVPREYENYSIFINLLLSHVLPVPLLPSMLERTGNNLSLQTFQS